MLLFDDNTRAWNGQTLPLTFAEGTVSAGHQSVPRSSSRRSFFRHIALAFGATMLAPLSGCGGREPPLRIASNTWPGYELMYLARERRYFDSHDVRLVEMPSATACLHALSAGTVEGAALTLDETLSAIAGGLDLRVVAVLDISMGADVLLAHPDITKLEELKGRRIGVEQTAVGAVMLATALHQAALAPSEVQIISLAVNEHRDRFLSRSVDAVITFEPVISQLAGSGALQLFSSADIPGEIIDVLAVKPDALERSPLAVRALLDGHFKAREDWLADPGAAAPIMAQRLRIDPVQIPAAFNSLDLPDRAANRNWLRNRPSRLEFTADRIGDIMLRARLLREPVSTAGLADPRFLGEA